MTGRVRIEHIGASGVRVGWADAALVIDPPRPVHAPVVVTWSELERVAGARACAGPVAAVPAILAWLGIAGIPLHDEADVGGFRVRATP